jgi:HSP20 family protein
MSIIRWKPWHEIDKIFETIAWPEGHWLDLAADVYEKNGNVIVEMHVPGIDPDNIDIKVNDSHLYVSGTREEKKEVKHEHYYHREIRRGGFERVIQLPCDVVQKEIKAEFKDGVLVITMPKEQHAEAKKIAVVRK